MQGVVCVDRSRRSCIPSVNAQIAEAMCGGAPIRVSQSLDRKSAARLAEASVRNLAIKARAAPAPALFGAEKALHKACRLETVIDRDKNV
jgi:hypothetical protein